MDEGVMVQRDKWEKYASVVDTDTSSKLATFALTAAHTVDLLCGKREGVLLDVGCGFGEIALLLAQKTNFQIVGCDISKKCIEDAKERARRARVSHRMRVEEGDVFALPYEDSSFDVVVSFGYASAATYKGAQDEVARVLKPGGLLICDFSNHLSLYKIAALRKGWSKYVNEEGKHYNSLTLSGIGKHFAKYGLKVRSQRLFNVYPPLNFLSADLMILFDKIIGRLLSKVLGRVRIVCFQKV